MIIAIGNDHLGYQLKLDISEHLKKQGHQVIDVGCNSNESTNYAVYAINCAKYVAAKDAEFGIVCCGSGVGVSIAANKVNGIRCALCSSIDDAILTRQHNNSNVLAIGANKVTTEIAIEMVKHFITTKFEGGRHQVRVDYIKNFEQKYDNSSPVFKYILEEEKRQNDNLELIASENYVSPEILAAAGSILTNKYAEGYPGKRYYGGCEYVDKIESYAIAKLIEIFGCEHANVQPHSGSQANEAVYSAVLKPGDIVLGMDLGSGGHLTHGHKLNFSGKTYNFVSYFVDKQTQLIDYDQVRTLAHQVKPKLIVAGASSYSRIIDFAAFRQIADEVGAYLMVDMAHIAGLVAANLHPSPIPYAHFITSTTHKTLRGPRGGIILTTKDLGPLIDKSVFPGTQGGPLMHIIGAKAICFEKVLSPQFIEYQKNVVKNAQVLAKTLQEEGFEIISGGTDNHLLTINVKRATNLSGKEAEVLLDSINITCNKNAIPYDTLPPNAASGLRFGSPALTTRGLVEEDFVKIGKIIAKALFSKGDSKVLKRCQLEVKDIIEKYPLGGIIW